MSSIAWPYSTSPGLKPSEGAGRLINCYAEPLGKGARAEYVHHRVPGMTSFGTTARTGFRGSVLVAGVLYSAFSGKIEKWSSTGGATTNVGNLTGTKKGFFAYNNAATPDKVFCDPDGNVATFTPTTVTNSFDADLPSSNSVTALNGYFIFTTGLGQIWATGLNAVTVDPLSFTTDQASGGLVRGITFAGRLLAFGNKTTGVYNDAGTQPFPLAKVTTIQRGIAGPYCVAGFEDNFARGLHFVGEDNKVYRLDGITPVPVSPPDLDGLIESVSDKTTLEMSAYISRGHGFIELSSSTWTWVLNTSTGWWHEKAKYLGVRSRITGTTVYAFGKWLAGDTDSGNIFQITKDSYLEDTYPITTQVWSLPIQKFPSNLRVASTWIDITTGVGIATGSDPIATDPDIEIDWSDDGGQSFQTARVRKTGRQALGKTRVRVNQCGRSGAQGRIIRVKQSSPVHFGLMGGEMAAELRVPT